MADRDAVAQAIYEARFPGAGKRYGEKAWVDQSEAVKDVWRRCADAVAPSASASVEGVLAILDAHEASARERAAKFFEMDLPAHNPSVASAFAVEKALIKIGEEVRASLTPATPVSAPSPAGGVREALERILEPLRDGKVRNVTSVAREILLAFPALSSPAPSGEGRRILERAADEGYRVCAETRHVSLGDKVRAAILALSNPAPDPMAGATLERQAFEPHVHELGSDTRVWEAGKGRYDIGQRPNVLWRWGIGTLLRKKSGSWWEGRVVGFYSTEQTPHGYAIQLDKPNGPVQIYPESALEEMK